MYDYRNTFGFVFYVRTNFLITNKYKSQTWDVQWARFQHRAKSCQGINYWEKKNYLIKHFMLKFLSVEYKNQELN